MCSVRRYVSTSAHVLGVGSTAQCVQYTGVTVVLRAYILYVPSVGHSRAMIGTIQRHRITVPEVCSTVRSYVTAYIMADADKGKVR